MRELEQSAGIFVAGDVATHEPCRHFAYRRLLHRRLNERALKELIAKVYDRCQIRTSADPTALLVENMHLGVSFATRDAHMLV